MKAADIMNDIFRLKYITAVTVKLDQDGKWTLNLVNLKIIKKRPVIIDQKSFHSEEDFFNRYSSKSPVCLVITGKGILQKKIELQEKCSDDELIRRILPNANTRDLFVHVVQPNEHQYEVTIVRQSVIDNIITKFSSQKLQVIELFFDKYFVNTFTNVFEQQLNEEQAIAVNAAYQFLRFQKGRSSSQSQNIRKQWLDNYYGRVTKRLSIGFLTLCFLMLMINFLSFDYYNKRLAELSGRGDQVESQLQLYDKLKDELANKKQVLSESGFERVSRISFYLDRIADSRCEGITLTEIDVNPKQDKLRGDDISFRCGEIFIKGRTKNSLDLNKWVNILKDNTWTEMVSIKGYNQLSKEPSAEFQLNIKLKF